MNVDAILREKGSNVTTTVADAPISDVVAELVLHKIGAVVVVKPDRSVVGILSERDIVKALSRHGSETLGMPARALMTSNVIVCDRQESVNSLMEKMTDGRFRHLPVVEDGKLAGIVSIGDVVRARIDVIQSEASAMRDYIASS